MKNSALPKKINKIQSNAGSENKNSAHLWPGLNPWLVVGTSFLLALILLLISSKSSPLYPFNDWTDAHTFFTVGKGMFEGKVPYRDLFDQKGPLLYFIYGLGSLISKTTFLGLFIFEVFALAIFLYFSFRIMALFLTNQYALIALPLVAASVLNLRSFGHGGSAEELSLPLIAISLYYLISYFKKQTPRPMSTSVVIFNGVIAGSILWIKYSFVGFWLAWIATLILNLMIHKQHAAALKSAAYFIAGMLIATLPWLIYFGWHGALRDWFEAYFLINLTAYPMSLTVTERIKVPIESLRRHFSFNPLAISVLVLGMLLFIVSKKYIKELSGRFGLGLMTALLILGVYGGGRDYVYYFYVFAAFLPLGFVVLLNFSVGLFRHIKNKLVYSVLIAFVLVGAVLYTLRFQRNTYMLRLEKVDMVQYRFAAILRLSPNPSLLNYGFQDSGFYTAAGITPNTRFFQSYNIDYGSFPLPEDEQNRYIQDALVDFLVLRTLPDEDIHHLHIPNLYENYALITAQSQYFGDTEFNYLLFQKIK